MLKVASTFSLKPVPEIDALAQRVAAVCPHLLAAVPLAVGQDENLPDFEAQVFGNLGEDDVHGDAGSRVAHVVIYHYQRRAGFKHTRTLGNDTSHFIKITSHHPRDAVVVQQVELFLRVQVGQNRLQELLSVRCDDRWLPFRIKSKKILCSIFDRATKHLLTESDESRFVRSEQSEFERVSARVVVSVAVRRRSDDTIVRIRL